MVEVEKLKTVTKYVYNLNEEQTTGMVERSKTLIFQTYRVTRLPNRVQKIKRSYPNKLNKIQGYVQKHIPLKQKSEAS